MRIIFSCGFFCATLLCLQVACKSSSKLTNRINAVVLPAQANTVDSLVAVDDTVAAKAYDSLQVLFGDKLMVPYDSIYDLKLYAFIKNELGKKCFGKQKSGYNCSSFLSVLFKEVYDIDFPTELTAQMKNSGLDLYKDTAYLKQGDVLFFNNRPAQPGMLSHAGFYLQNGFFVVGAYTDGIMLANLSRPYWSRYFIAAGRIKSLVAE